MLWGIAFNMDIKDKLNKIAAEVVRKMAKRGAVLKESDHEQEEAESEAKSEGEVVMEYKEDRSKKKPK